MLFTFRRIYLICSLLVILAIAYYVAMDHMTPLTSNAYIQTNVLHLSSLVSGQMQHIYVKDNQSIHKGQLLFSLDPSSYRARLNQLQAQYRYQAHRLEQDKILLAHAVISQDTFLAQQSLVTTVHNQITVAKLNLQHTRIYAPIDGELTHLNLSVGTQLSAGLAVMSIIDTRSWMVVANYKENNLGGSSPEPGHWYLFLYIRENCFRPGLKRLEEVFRLAIKKLTAISLEFKKLPTGSALPNAFRSL
ncbi:HlyD family secretion protein [Dongshaea marina]|uniref:HlyD family secretion protein n=1 Tax=Dongshaea marina TaxID=2047966 RepID=UPI000D3E0739|nr:biotin/lipoyl-binding protein [Dongshaea marina]